MAAKIFSIVLSAMVLFQSLGFHSSDVFQLESLMSHLRAHEEDFGDNLFSFLDKHYGLQQKQHHSEDGDQEHQRLPFKHKMCKISNAMPVILPKTIRWEQVVILPSNETPHFLSSKYSFLNQFDIFQPPRLA